MKYKYVLTRGELEDRDTIDLKKCYVGELYTVKPEVGYLRKFGYVDAKFDETANNLCSNTYSVKISRSDLKPGDWVGRDGHIGTYVGGGYVVEFYGGAYGCQLTHVDSREGYDFIQGKTVAGTKWTKFRDPRYY